MPWIGHWVPPTASTDERRSRYHVARGAVIGPLIDMKGVEKVEAHIADAVKKGAKVVTGGKRAAQGSLAQAKPFCRGTVFEIIDPTRARRWWGFVRSLRHANTFGPLEQVGGQPQPMPPACCARRRTQTPLARAGLPPLVRRRQAAVGRGPTAHCQGLAPRRSDRHAGGRRLPFPIACAGRPRFSSILVSTRSHSAVPAAALVPRDLAATSGIIT